MIEFHCKNCKKRLRVEDAKAGKKGRCPRCKNIVVVPLPEVPASAEANHNLEFSFLDGPPIEPPTPHAAVAGEEIAADLPTMYTGRTAVLSDKEAQTTKRKLPWPIDIFLYPMNTAGLTIIGILIGLPLIIGLVLFVLGAAAISFPPLFVVVAALGFIAWLVRITLWLYMYWFYCECIRDSAEGGLRAPETMARTPGLFEMLGQLFKVIVCLLFFFLPVAVYAFRADKVDILFWALLFYGVFFFPMGLLAVVMFDSVSGLNPILIIGSIFSTFLPYCALVVFFLVFSVFVLVASGFLFGAGALLLLPGVFQSMKAFGIYMFMVGSHLLGRFYWRYQEKLNWEV